MGHGVQMVHRPIHRHRAEVPLVLDHAEHQRRDSHLQIGGIFAEVRVADDHVQPPVLLRIGVRLVAGVDDRTFQVVSSPTSTSKKSAR